jgi:hypothetical protein
MSTKQGDLSLLNDPVAQNLLQSNQLAHLAYIWFDGTPRVTPIWFHWNGEEIVMASPPGMPKIKALQENPDVAVTIDDSEWPYKILQIRGRVKVDLVDGIPSEYADCADRYFGPEAGPGWTQQMDNMFGRMFRFCVQPEWVGILDFEERFPNTIAAAMAG